MPSEENVIALIMQRDDLAALQLGLRGKQAAEEMGGEEAERGAEVVEDEFGEMVGGVSVAGEFFAFDPVGDGEVECGARGEVHQGEARGFLLVFF